MAESAGPPKQAPAAAASGQGVVPASSSAAKPAPLPPGPLVLIGTGHVFDIEATVRDAVVALAPDVVFVELDRGRLAALVDKRRGGTAPRAKAGLVHRKLQQFQEGIAGLYGAEVGSEMLAAVDGAHRVGARLALIDDPAETTMRRALAALTWREKLRAVGLLVKGGAQSLWPFGRKAARESVEAEIRRYQDDPEKALAELQRTFPSLHRTVIHDRDVAMARRIRKALAGARLGVAVVGDGHVGGLLRQLEGITVTTYRLGDVRGGRLPKPAVATGTPAEVRFGFDAVA